LFTLGVTNPSVWKHPFLQPIVMMTFVYFPFQVARRYQRPSTLLAAVETTLQRSLAEDDGSDAESRHGDVETFSSQADPKFWKKFETESVQVCRCNETFLRT